MGGDRSRERAADGGVGMVGSRKRGGWRKISMLVSEWLWSVGHLPYRLISSRPSRNSPLRVSTKLTFVIVAGKIRLNNSDDLLPKLHLTPGANRRGLVGESETYTRPAKVGGWVGEMGFQSWSGVFLDGSDNLISGPMHHKSVTLLIPLLLTLLREASGMRQVTMTLVKGMGMNRSSRMVVADGRFRQGGAGSLSMELTHMEKAVSMANAHAE